MATDTRPTRRRGHLILLVGAMVIAAAAPAGVRGQESDTAGDLPDPRSIILLPQDYEGRLAVGQSRVWAGETVWLPCEEPLGAEASGSFEVVVDGAFQVSQSAVGYVSENDAIEAFARAADATTTPSGQAECSATIGDSTYRVTGVRDAVAHIGDETLSLEGSVERTGSSRPMAMHLVRSGPLITSLTVVNVDEPPSEGRDIEALALAALADRLDDPRGLPSVRDAVRWNERNLESQARYAYAVVRFMDSLRRPKSKRHKNDARRLRKELDRHIAWLQASPMPPLTDELGAYYERLSVAVRPLLRCRNAKRCAALVREEWSPVVATGAPARRLVALAVQRPEIIGPPPDRSSPVATALGEGRVMISGGSHVPYGLGYAEHAAELQVYDSATGSFEALGRLSIPPVDHTATLLPKGRVLIVGGSDDFLNRQMEAFVWDPTDGSTTYAGTLYHSRVGHTATPLPDGRVLILGGEDGWDQSAGETWSPLVQEFEPSPGLDEFRAFHSATLLPDGLVLVVGGAGTGEDGPDALASARLIDPVSGEVTEAGTLAAPRFSHTAVLADDGGVLIIGGTTLDDGTYGLGTTVERWDPEERSFSTVGELLHPRRGSTITPLSDGRVVIAGGTIETPDGFEVTDSVEVWDPESYTSSEATPLRDSRNDHAAVLLEDDAVLLVGGLEDPARSLSDAEVWRG